MTSEGKKCRPLILEAVSKSGLNEKVVKDWIGNTSRKNNTHYSCAKGFYSKGVSGYNLFVKNNKVWIQLYTQTFTSIAPKCIQASTSTQRTYIKTIKRLADKHDEQTQSHSQWTESKANTGPPDLCLKRKLKHTDLEVYSVKAINAQRKRRGIQQYLVEWEGYIL
ncbi:hypothetical protein CHS0354_005857 [Potamilus streckersoni]|uniref:Chromo domain-containing protein n=1 Tax=Potamilus streckersoni TaxID=2493646 RepID=A0AAE0SLD2_9BIVA|nr:hypothetical protein CHS0354_005857 [Potamilus streckersoni]